MLVTCFQCRQHIRCVPAGRDSHDNVRRRDVLFKKGLPTFLHIVFLLLKIKHQILHTSGKNTLYHFRRHSAGVRNLQHVQDGQLASGAGSAVEHPASVPDLALYRAYQSLKVRKHLFDRKRNLLVLLIDFTQQLGHAFFLKIVMQRRLLGKS